MDEYLQGLLASYAPDSGIWDRESLVELFEDVKMTEFPDEVNALDQLIQECT